LAKASDAEWWRGASIYQVYPLSFVDANGDGWGDLPGVTSRLEYVASLGVDAIWLAPFYTSAWVDYGYDTIDQKSVDPRCGTLADFDALLRRAHELDLRVLVDQVYTYTSNRHPWFLESRSSRDAARAQWYDWQDARADGTPPNNWMSIFGGPAWAWDLERRQYYMTHFLEQMPHLRVQEPPVQEALLDIGRFWLERGVDGFRLDVINLAMVDPLRRDNPPSGESGFQVPAHGQLSVFDASRPENLAFVARIRALADEAPGRFLMGEIAGRHPMADAREYTRGDRHLHSAYYLLSGGTGPLRAAALRAELEAWSDPADGWPTWSFSNHDVVRGVSRCGGDAAPQACGRLIVALLACARGTALLYQGDELGLPDGDVPFERLRDPATRRFHPTFLQRDGSRTPMPWSATGPALGFSAGEPWLPAGPRHAALAVERQAADTGSTLAWTRRLLGLRRSCPALRRGELRFFDLPEPILGFERRHGAQRLACAFNVSATTARVDWPGLATAPVLLESGAARASAASLSLDPYGFIVADLSAADTSTRTPEAAA
jgi:alpha-glucosidase